MANGRVAELTGSAYRDALAKIGGPGTDDIRQLNSEQRDQLFEYLEQHRLKDITLCVGYWLVWAERNLNMNQSDVADAAGVTRSFISSLLSGRTLSKPETFERIARATGANPVEFLVAAGLVEPSDILAYQVPGRADLQVLADKLIHIPAHKRQKYVTLAASILDLAIDETLGE